MESSILSIKNLHKRYGKIHAVNNVSLEIHKGNVYGILGPNGSGKSTLLAMLQGVKEPSYGKIHIPDDVVFGYVPQVIEDFETLRVCLNGFKS